MEVPAMEPLFMAQRRIIRTEKIVEMQDMRRWNQASQLYSTREAITVQLRRLFYFAVIVFSCQKARIMLFPLIASWKQLCIGDHMHDRILTICQSEIIQGAPTLMMVRYMKQRHVATIPQLPIAKRQYKTTSMCVVTFMVCQSEPRICKKTSILLEKMLRIFPIGVTSKNVLTVALRTYLKVSLWIFCVISLFILMKTNSRIV